MARSLVPADAAAGTVIIREGDSGDQYDTIAAGEASVVHAGAVTATLRRGDGSGEIALLREVPRTATVIAATDMQLYTLEKDAFLAAVTGHAPTRGSRIAWWRPPAGPGGRTRSPATDRRRPACGFAYIETYPR